MPVEDAKAAIVKVGKGRGFLVASQRWPDEPYVITAAHCLPGPYTFARLHDTPFLNILGPLVGGPQTIAAECCFMDPVSDVAVLAPVDGQSAPDEHDKYEALPAGRPVSRIVAPRLPAKVSLLTRRGAWEVCEVPATVPLGRHLSLVGNKTAYAPGTSGSPILNEDGRAIGVVSFGEDWNPILALCLPAWLLSDVIAV